MALKAHRAFLFVKRNPLGKEKQQDDIMGTVALTFKIMPESPETDLAKLKGEIKGVIAKHEEMELKNITEMPIAFGLISLEILITMPDKVRGTDALEEDLSNIPEVSSVEAGDVTLL